VGQALAGEDALDGADGRQGLDTVVMETRVDDLCPARQAPVVQVEPFEDHERFDLGAAEGCHGILSGPWSPARMWFSLRGF